MTANLAPAPSTVLGGTELARAIRRRVSEDAAALTAAGAPPRLAVVVATDDESSAWYVRSIAKAASPCGITCEVVDLGPDAGPERIREALTTLSAGVGPVTTTLLLQHTVRSAARSTDV